MTNIEKSPLQFLKTIFQDSPNVLRMLGVRELDLTDLESEALIREQKVRELFPEPVNLYATGRTGSGKTSLGNSLLDADIRPMTSHGYLNCTDSVQYFLLKSNLKYFDLPGAGSDERYENINRAALLIEQLQYEDEGISPVTELIILDFSKYSLNKKPSEKLIEVNEWQSERYQAEVSPDIILYVIAPHMQFLRGDRSYLRALFKSLKERNSSSKVIFALNIHHSQEGTPKPTPQNIQDARQKITEIYERFYPGEPLLIAEIDCLKGTGFSEIAKFICSVLPLNKIGNMEKVLRGELKEAARKERSRRYRQILIYIASRLATYPVDMKIGKGIFEDGKGILEEAYAAVCDYGIRTFIEEDAYLESSRNLYEMIDAFASKTKISREEAIKILVSEVEEREVTQSEIVGYAPKYEDVPVSEQYIDYEEEIRDANSLGSMAGGAAIGAAAGLALGSLLGPFAPLGMLAGGALGAGAVPKKRTTEMTPIVKEITRLERRLVDFEEQRKDVTKKVPHVVQKEKEVGVKYLQGGYPVIESLFAIGLSLESMDPTEDWLTDFENAVKKKQGEVRTMLSRYEGQINQLAERSTTQEEARQAEEEIIKILEQAVMN